MRHPEHVDVKPGGQQRRARLSEATGEQRACAKGPKQRHVRVNWDVGREDGCPDVRQTRHVERPAASGDTPPLQRGDPHTHAAAAAKKKRITRSSLHGGRTMLSCLSGGQTLRRAVPSRPQVGVGRQRQSHPACRGSSTRCEKSRCGGGSDGQWYALAPWPTTGPVH